VAIRPRPSTLADSLRSGTRDPLTPAAMPFPDLCPSEHLLQFRYRCHQLVHGEDLHPSYHLPLQRGALRTGIGRASPTSKWQREIEYSSRRYGAPCLSIVVLLRAPCLTIHFDTCPCRVWKVSRGSTLFDMSSQGFHRNY